MPNANAAPAAALPRPKVPLAPALSLRSFARARGAPVASLLDLPHRHVTSGRIAIALAVRALGIGAGQTVLMPAYHSLSMLPPLELAGAGARFYRVGMDGMVDLDDVAAKLDASVKALLVTHYFGFVQDLTALRAFCDAHGLALIEDCAHCLLGSHAGRPVGSFGDYAIGSSMKFYPIYEGGTLASARRPLDGIALRSAGPGFEAKAALAALEYGFSYGRMAPLLLLLRLPLMLKSWLWGRLKRGGGARALTPASADSSFEFDPRWLDKRAALFSRLMLRLVSRRRMARRRRAHYATLAAAVAGLPGCRPLHATLPPDVVPWLFPLLVDDPEALVARLLAAGVPVTRFGTPPWPGVDEQVCANSLALSRRVLAFPCHQELRPAELAWIAAQLRAALLA